MRSGADVGVRQGAGAGHEWRPVTLPFLLRRYGLRDRRVIALLAGWVLLTVVCVAAGVATQDWGGLPLPFGSLDAYVTVYPPLILCTWAVFWMGLEWAFVPAYLATLILSVDAGMPLGWALLFAVADPLSLAVYALLYRGVRVPYDLRQSRSVAYFLLASFIGAVAGSSGSFIWSYTLGSPEDVFRIWQGWWAGGLLQAVFINAPVLLVASGAVERLKQRHLAPPEPPPLGRGWMVASVLVATGVLAGFVAATDALARSWLATTLQGAPPALQEGVTDVVASWQLLAWLAVILIVGSAATAVFAAREWSRALRREVLARTNELEDATRRWEALVEMAPEGIFVNRGGRIVYANKAALRLFGASRPDRLLGRSPLSLVREDYRESVARGIEDLVERGAPSLLEERVMVRLDGSEIIVEASASVFRDPSGDAIQVMVRDITDRRRYEEGLRRTTRALSVRSQVSEALVRAETQAGLLGRLCEVLVETAGYSYAWVGIAEHDTRRTIRSAAQAGEGSLPGPAADATWSGDPDTDGPTGQAVRTGEPIVHGRIADLEPAAWRDALVASGLTGVAALPVELDADGRTGVLTVYFGDERSPTSVTDVDTEEIELLREVAADLTFGFRSLRARYEREAALDALREAHANLEDRVEQRTHELAEANARLQELDHLKSMFIASMSHELRTPLNSIIGFTGVVLQGISGELNPTQRDQLSRVQAAAKHLLVLISEIIDLSKIEAGIVETHAEHFDLRDLVTEAVDGVSAQARAKGIGVGSLVPEDVQMYTDRRRLLQCLLNLLSNAVKFTHHGEVTVTAEVSDDRVDLTVSDTGIGIAPEDLARLFRPFVQVGADARSRPRGTGLGLYLTRKLATEILGGTVDVRSDPHVGSAFTLSVPRWLPPQPPGEASGDGTRE